MRILFHLEAVYPPEGIGGVQIGMHELAQALIARGHEPIVLVGRPPGERDQPPIDEVYGGYRLIRAGRPTDLIKPLVDSLAIDAVIVQTTTRVVGAMVACIDAAVPCVVYMHNVETQHWGGYLIADPAFLYLSTSEFVAKRVRAMFGVESHVVLSYIDPARHRAEATGRKVLFVNPHPNKGVETFFAVAERLRNVPFLVCESWEIGEEWRNACFRRVAPWGNVDWRRQVADMRPVWAETRLLLVPSIWEEAWGRIVSEAQLNGIPVIASTRGGLPESVGPGGILLDAHADAAHWTAAIARSWDDPREYERLASATRRHAARAEIQPDYVLERFMALVGAHVDAARAHKA